MKRLGRVEEILLVPILAAMAALAFAGAGVPIAYIEEVAPDLFVWATFLGAALAARHRAHPGLSVLRENLPPGLRRWLDGIVAGLTVLFFGVLAVQGIRAVGISIRMGETTALGAPAYWVTLAVPIGAALYIYRVLNPADPEGPPGGGVPFPINRPAGHAVAALHTLASRR